MEWEYVFGAQITCPDPLGRGTKIFLFFGFSQICLLFFNYVAKAI